MKYKRLAVVLLLCVGLFACGKTEATNSDVLQQLTEAQKQYLYEQNYTDEGILLMDYESINYELLGTGLELYNPSSGVEKKGVTYSLDKSEDSYYYEGVKMGEAEITFDEALHIRMKEKEMRVDDFLSYKGELKLLEEQEQGKRYRLMLPIAEYKDTYVKVLFTESMDGLIEMRAPFVYYQENEDSGQTFSFFYKTAMMDAFFTDENQPHYEENMIYGMQYSSLTNSSLVLELYNMTTESKKWNASFELYRIYHECYRINI